MGIWMIVIGALLGAWAFPAYRLPALKLDVRLAIVPPLAVQYAVHQEQPFVFLKSVTPLSGSGL